MDNYKRVSYEGKDYAIFAINYKDTNVPAVLDWNDFIEIKKLNKNWRCNQNGFISCSHTLNGQTKDVHLHELVMILQNRDAGIKSPNKSILHVNRVGLDNRRNNLIYDTVNKDLNKNLKKKKRTISLPKNCGIRPDEIPTYIWYMQPDSSHGERFMVNIGDINWKTSSSNNLSLRYKLEEAKMYLRNLLKTRADLMQEYSMNGDYTREGKELLHTYYDIVHHAGAKHIKRFIPENNTLDLLKTNYAGLSYEEQLLLKDKKDSLKDDIY
ncbi:hypothetical protein QKU48_gp0467 [Fadolivirus algeromassiliense]|jgi:hypothetical protein|uniref:Uncharacterized protein n=1 Tax=Fadolivirus FV1/VV64 TaxID=3070911 RepID=A0A7D3QU75_9VIRU|nr:hypothetical protein QKU48_gp0467 [Fadolivirus algeromassiliense]QKF93925.1 hypothetical protein Fadolivirus_1_467 [Fadolivirus FV1/VV64]